jgi:hypothetical protein
MSVQQHDADAIELSRHFQEEAKVAATKAAKAWERKAAEYKSRGSIS